MSPHRTSGTAEEQNRPSQNFLGDLQSEAIAVVGYSINFPGDATCADGLWDLMMSKRTTSTNIPKNRLNIEAFYHPDRNRTGQIPTCYGHFLKRDLAKFDASFFQASSQDAATMDPQQRLLLECTYRALENAGIPMESISGSRTSVYNGSFCMDWSQLCLKDSEARHRGTSLGTQPSVNANRISWFFNLLGNSVNLDTACSSSLVALDMGCKDLQAKRENMSIVAGSNIMISPDALHSLANLNMLSPDGLCYSFDHRANGYSRGEGVGVLVLKRVSDAIRDNDTIRGIIRNTGCNQDGHTSAMVLPNPSSQEKLIIDTYDRAGLSMEPTRFFEAHGTGTPVGDPLESRAIGAAFKNVRTREDPMWVGAVKSNIGHLEGCSGIAGVVKALLTLERGVIPPNASFEKINPAIDADFLRLKFPTQPTPWPVQGLRRASVNSFGNSGTNAHVILDDVYHFLEERHLQAAHLTVKDPPTPERLQLCMVPGQIRPQTSINVPSPNASKQTKMIVISGVDKDAPQRIAKDLATHFRKIAGQERLGSNYLDDLAYTLSTRRSLLPWKSYAIVNTIQDLESLDTRLSSSVKALQDPGLAFVFTGQGAQWPCMAQELMSFTVFETSILKSENYLLELGCQWHLRKELFKAEDSRIGMPELSQPLCTAVQIALIDVLHSCGVLPSAVIGHSSGEIAAAYCTGSISHKSAIRIAYYRGLLAGRLAVSSTRKGAMMAVGLSNESITPYVDQMNLAFRSSDLVVSCVNSLKNTTVSGPIEMIGALQTVLEQDHIFARQLHIDVAYHSPHMQNIATQYLDLIQELEEGTKPKWPVAMFSSVSGRRITISETAKPQYWVSNLVSPVNFLGAFKALLTTSAPKGRRKLDLSHRLQFRVDMAVEIGPHSALQAPINDTISKTQGASNIKYASLLVRNNAGDNTFLNAMGQVHSLGYPVHIQKINRLSEKPGTYATVSNLPEYSFDHSKHYWHVTRLAERYRNTVQGKLDLLGKPAIGWNNLEPRWRNILKVSEMPWMEDHIINGSQIYPGAGMIVMVIEAARQLVLSENDVEGFELKDVAFLKPLVIPSGSSGAEAQLVIHLARNDSLPLKSWSEWRLITYENNEWSECCRGHLRLRYTTNTNIVDSGKRSKELLMEKRKLREAVNLACQQALDITSFYQNARQSGLAYGPSFQRICSGSYNEMNQTSAVINLYEWPASQFPQPHVVHPTTLDCMFHVGLASYTRGGARPIPTMIPTHLGKIYICTSGLSYPDASNAFETAALKMNGTQTATIDGLVFDRTGEKVLLEFSDLQLTVVADNNTKSLENGHSRGQVPYHIVHKPDSSLLNPTITTALCQPTISTESSGLGRYIELLAHKSSGLRTLAIDTIGQSVTTRISDFVRTETNQAVHLNGKISHLCILAPTDSCLTEAENRLGQHPALSYRVGDFKLSAEEQNFDRSSYDIVVAPMALGENVAYLEFSRDVVKPGGKLILYESQECTKDERFQADSSVQSHLEEVGFTAPSFKLTVRDQSESEPALASVHGLGARLLTEADNHRLYIVINPDSTKQQMFAKSIASYLNSQGISDSEIISIAEAIEIGSNYPATFVVASELDEPLLYSMDYHTYELLKAFLITVKSVVWLTTGDGSDAGLPDFSLVNGLARALRNEYATLRFTTIFFEQRGTLSENQLLALVTILQRNHLSSGSVGEDIEYVEINGIFNIPRIAPAVDLMENLDMRSATTLAGIKAVKDAPPLLLTLDSPGLFDSLQFVEDKLPTQPLRPDEIEIHVHAIGINFKDCLIALGRIEGAKLGQECAGIVTRVGSEVDFGVGDRVVLTHPDVFRTVARAKAYAAFALPPNLNFEVAAAITVQFATAWTALVRTARIKQGETVLIHSGTSGTGQAAIQIAQMFGAEIYTTVGSDEKKRLLMQEYLIPEARIFYSRSSDFADSIKQATKGRGVDVILNSLAGDLLLASWECIAPLGRFVEIGKKDILSNTKLPMSMFNKNASFHGLDGAYLFSERQTESRADIKELIQLVADGKLRPAQPMQIQDIGSILEVFKVLQSGNQCGKTVLTIKPESRVPTVLAPEPSFRLESEASFVIAGGLGGIGRATARFLTDRGARFLVLLSRGGPRTDDAFQLIKELQGKGVQVHTPACDVSDLCQIQTVFGNLSASLPPIKGCFNASLVAKDCLFEEMSFADWRDVVHCKAAGSWNLHSVLPKGMDFFVMLASGSGLIGIKGQSNYDAGNVYEDALARYRVAHGEKATAFDLGAMADDGALAEDPALLKRVLAYGSLEPVTRQKYFALLDYYCNPSLSLLSPTESQVALGLGFGGGDGLEAFDYDRQPMLGLLKRMGESIQEKDNSNELDVKSLIKKSTSLAEVGQIAAQVISTKLSKSLSSMTDAFSDMDKPLQMQGVDSLLATQLRNWIVKEFAADIAVFETQGASTLGTLSMIIARRTTIMHPEWSIFEA